MDGGMAGAATDRSWWFDAALALLVTAVELWLLADDGQASARAVALTLVAGGSLVLRRAWPLAVLAITLAAATVIVIGDEAPGGVSVLVALYTTAEVCERRVSLTALVPTAAIMTALSVARADGAESTVLVGAIATAPLAVGIWALGAYTRTRRGYLQELRERAILLERERDQLARLAVHEERTAIARELHDIVAHSVTVMLVGVRGARDVLRSSPAAADDTLARVEASGEQSLAELRRVLHLLRRPDGAGESAPQPSVADLEDLVASYRDAGLPVRLAVSGEARPLPDGVQVSVYRIVEEALTNVLKHSRPDEVTVELAYRGPGLELEIVDDGDASPDGDAPEGHGVLGMRERVLLLGGELETGRVTGGGFRVAARLPIGGGR